MRPTQKFVAFIWLGVGLVLSLYNATNLAHLWNHRLNFGYCFVFAACWCFGLIVLAGAILTLLKRKPGKLFLKLASVLALLYTADFVLFAGWHDVGWFYAALVLLLCLLSVLTFKIFLLRKKSPAPKNTTAPKFPPNKACIQRMMVFLHLRDRQWP